MVEDLDPAEGEGDVPELDFPFHGRVIHSVGPVHDQGTGIIHLNDLVGRGGEPLQIVDEVAEVAHGVG